MACTRCGVTARSGYVITACVDCGKPFCQFCSFPDALNPGKWLCYPCEMVRRDPCPDKTCDICENASVQGQCECGTFYCTFHISRCHRCKKDACSCCVRFRVARTWFLCDTCYEMKLNSTGV